MVERRRFMTKLSKGELETLEDYSEWFGVSADASYEEIDRVFNNYIEEHRRTDGIVFLEGRYYAFSTYPYYPLDHDEMEQHPVPRVYKILKSKKKCLGCNKFFMLGENFCSQTCSELYQLKTSTIQELINKFQQTQVSFEDLFHTGGINFIDLFEINNCQCEHPGMTINDYTNHIRNCLTTREQIQNFKNEILRIIQVATQNRPLPQNNNQPTTPANNNYSNYTNYDNSSPASNNTASTPSNSSPEAQASPNYSQSSERSSNGNQEKPNEEQQQTEQPANFSENENKSSKENSNQEEKNVSSNNPSTSSFSSPRGNEKLSSAKPKPPSIPSSGISETSSAPSSEPNPTDLNELTEKKQQIIQEVQEKINKHPNLNLNNFSNWEQEIEQMNSLKAVEAYQKSLLEKLKGEKELKQNIKGGSATKRNEDNNKSLVVGLLIGIGVLLLISLGHFIWKKKKSNQSK